MHRHHHHHHHDRIHIRIRTHIQLAWSVHAGSSLPRGEYNTLRMYIFSGGYIEPPLPPPYPSPPLLFPRLGTSHRARLSDRRRARRRFQLLAVSPNRVGSDRLIGRCVTLVRCVYIYMYIYVYMLSIYMYICIYIYIYIYIYILL